MIECFTSGLIDGYAGRCKPECFVLYAVIFLAIMFILWKGGGV